jgi:hypothetical protein
LHGLRLRRGEALPRPLVMTRRHGVSGRRDTSLLRRPVT